MQHDAEDCMFFTKAGRIVAWIGTVLGFLAMITGYEIDINQTASIFADVLPIETAQKAEAQGDVLRQQGATILFCGLILGILTEISRSVVGWSEQ